MYIRIQTVLASRYRGEFYMYMYLPVYYESPISSIVGEGINVIANSNPVGAIVQSHRGGVCFGDAVTAGIAMPGRG